MNLSGELITLIHKAQVATPEIDWLLAVTAAAVACRGVAAREMSADPKLDLDHARRLMLGQFINVLSMPAELVRVQNDGKDGSDLETVVIPPRKDWN